MNTYFEGAENLPLNDHALRTLPVDTQGIWKMEPHYSLNPLDHGIPLYGTAGYLQGHEDGLSFNSFLN